MCFRRAAVTASCLLLALAVGSAREARAQSDPADDPVDVGIEPAADDDVGSPMQRESADDDEQLPSRARSRWRRTPLPDLDARVAPEPMADPATADDADRDPADGGWDTLQREPEEHVGEAVVPPFSTSVDCPAMTAERRAVRKGGAELWCEDARGRRHGPFLRLHPSGTVALRGAYEGGRRDGVFLAWSLSGALEGKRTYVRGLEQGVEERFYAGGRRRSTTAYRAGKKHGPHRAWHENGRLAVAGEYVDDEATPGWKLYDEDGRIAGKPAAAETPASSSTTAEQDAPISAKLAGAGGGAVGAAAGLLVGAPLAMGLVQLSVVSIDSPQGWLTILLLPPLFAATGAVLGTALLTRFPGPLMAGVAAALGFPFGALLGSLVGGALASGVSLAVLTGGAGPETALGFLVLGLGVGALSGAALGPGAAAATVGWVYADSHKVLE